MSPSPGTRWQAVVLVTLLVLALLVVLLARDSTMPSPSRPTKSPSPVFPGVRLE